MNIFWETATLYTLFFVPTNTVSAYMHPSYEFYITKQQYDIIFCRQYTIKKGHA